MTTDDFSSSRRRATDHAGSASARSADEIREAVKETVGKGLAAVAGVADGINETMQETHLDETVEQAVRQVGETAHKVVRAAREETDNIRSAFKGQAAPNPQEEPAAAGKFHAAESAYDSSASAGSSFGLQSAGSFGATPPYQAALGESGSQDEE